MPPIDPWILLFQWHCRPFLHIDIINVSTNRLTNLTFIKCKLIPTTIPSNLLNYYCYFFFLFLFVSNKFWKKNQITVDEQKSFFISLRRKPKYLLSFNINICTKSQSRNSKIKIKQSSVANRAKKKQTKQTKIRKMTKICNKLPHNAIVLKPKIVKSLSPTASNSRRQISRRPIIRHLQIQMVVIHPANQP